MPTIINLIFSMLLLSVSYSAMSQDITGRWITFDDETQQAKSIVNIQFDGQYYSGTIVELINPSSPNPVCERCMAPLKNQPILGLQIISKAKKVKHEYKGGKILDPQNGKFYSLILSLDSKNSLKVKGFVGFSLFGRSQIWQRERPIQP